MESVTVSTAETAPAPAIDHDENDALDLTDDKSFQSLIEHRPVDDL
jgi:hypothetical protein